MLKGIKVVEIAGLAPGPMCGMILADFGASVIKIDRVGAARDYDCMAEKKRSIAIDLKQPKGKQLFQRISAKSDVLIEPFRPGVMEGLDLGPSDLMKRNDRLIFTRLSGYGQTGPMSKVAGHDINYLSIAGVLSMLGRGNDKPTPPINLLADFAGGSLLTAFAIVAAIHERETTGKGRVLDMSLTEGAAYVSSWLFRSRQHPDFDFIWPSKDRGKGVLDGGFPLYDTYETKDGQYMAVGAIEPQFQAAFCEKFGIEGLNPGKILGDPSYFRQKIVDHFRTKTQKEWCQIFDYSEACVTPVIPWYEAHKHPQNIARGAFRTIPTGKHVPSPVPTNITSSKEPLNSESGENFVALLKEFGYSQDEIKHLTDVEAIGEIGNSKL